VPLLIADSSCDLPPSVFARPLPSFQNEAQVSRRGKGQDREKEKIRKEALARQQKKEKKMSKTLKDDTPRDFKRLMSMQQGKRPIRSTLDDGNLAPSKKRKRSDREASDRKVAAVTKNGTSSQTATEDFIPLATETQQAPKILPGERLSDYYARVDQALPLSEVSSKGRKVLVDGKQIDAPRESKHNKKLRKKQENWRKEDAEYKRRLEEEKELLEEQEEERRELYGEEVVRFEKGTSKRRKQVGEVGDDDEDPWIVLKEKREAPKGLHDVVQAPPKFDRVPREKFKVSNGAKVVVDNVPNAAGSLRRREELGEARKSIITQYRQMMSGKKL
jgi:hypothetical protein